MRKEAPGPVWLRQVGLAFSATLLVGLLWYLNSDSSSRQTSKNADLVARIQSAGAKGGGGGGDATIKYETRGKLLSEYQKLQLEVNTVKMGVDLLRHQMHNEPQPPRADIFTTKTKAPRLREGNSSSEVQQLNKVDKKKSSGEDDTIFVSVASYRDLECPLTVKDMYKRALNPVRLFLGIIEQNEPEDVGCIPLEYYEEDCAGYPAKFGGFCPLNNIRIRRVLPFEARGPTFGRWVAGMMFQDEKYFMMIDSHNRFLKQWDQKLIDMYQLIPAGSKGVFSHYPNSWLNNSDYQGSEPNLMVMCYAHFLDLGYVRLGARVMPKSARPRLQPYAAAGFLFSSGALIREVPFDPYLDYVFDGEEILYSVRMWTHGWDMYSPTESVLFHFYLRKGANRVWTAKKSTGKGTVNWAPAQQISQKRVQYMLRATYPNSTIPLVPEDIQEPRIKRDLDIYGMGKARSLEEYWRFARIDPIAKKTDYSYCDSIQAKQP